MNNQRCAARAAVYGLVVSAAFVVSGCGDGGAERSTEAFCDTLRSEKERILAQFDTIATVAQNQEDEFLEVVMGLGAGVQAMGELRTYVTELERVAPDEIRTEMEIVADYVRDSVDNAGDAVDDPLGSMAGAVVDSFMVSGQVDAVHNFALTNCGEGL